MEKPEDEESEDVDWEFLLTHKEFKVVLECIKKCRNHLYKEIRNNGFTGQVLEQANTKALFLNDLYSEILSQKQIQKEERESKNNGRKTNVHQGT